MVSMDELVAFGRERLELDRITDFPGADNGLQVANNGTVTKLGAAVDASLDSFRQAREAGVDFLIVHHGLFWGPITPITGTRREKIKLLLEANLALYSAHLPLDRHPEIGNNALLAKALGLPPAGTFLPYEGVELGFVTEGLPRDELKARLARAFPDGCTAIEYGSASPERIGIVTGSGASVVEHLRGAGLDTLITGELKQHLFALAQEEQLNLYACGHYATETYGVRALAEEMAQRFDLPHVFLPSECPL